MSRQKRAEYSRKSRGVAGAVHLTCGAAESGLVRRRRKWGNEGSAVCASGWQIYFKRSFS